MPKNVPIPVIKAAEARAQGSSWQAAAGECGWSLDDLRRWIRKHQRAWYRELFRARRDVRDAACDEAVALLRMQLREKETKTRFDAASAVAKHFSTVKAKPRPAKNQEVPAEFLDILATVPEGTPTRVDLQMQAAAEEKKQQRTEN